MSTLYRPAFRNMENLFDIEGSPRCEEKVVRAIGTAVAGWTQVQLERKIRQLASVIREMNFEHFPIEMVLLEAD